MKNKKDFLSITDFSPKAIWEIIILAQKLKKESNQSDGIKEILKNKSLVMIFEKPSLRTRLSFEIGMAKLGGYSVYLGPSDIGMRVRESVSDIAKVTSSMGEIIVARTFKHRTIEELAKNSKVPVINGLSDLEHPCQALADFMTVWEIKGELEELKIAFIGDGANNITHSLCLGTAILGASFTCASPSGYWMRSEVVNKAKKIATKTGGLIVETINPQTAVADADIIYTDTWVSMGSEAEKEKRLRVFASYQVNKQLMKKAKKDAIFMHDLPAYRDSEVTTDVVDGSQSVVFQQAENRMWVQMALILYLLKNLPVVPRNTIGTMPLLAK